MNEGSKELSWLELRSGIEVKELSAEISCADLNYKDVFAIDFVSKEQNIQKNLTLLN